MGKVKKNQRDIGKDGKQKTISMFFQNGSSNKKTSHGQQSSLFTQIGKTSTGKTVSKTTEVASGVHQVSSGCHGDIDDDCVIVGATPKLKQFGKTALSCGSTKASAALKLGTKCKSDSCQGDADPAAKPCGFSKLNITEFDSPKDKVAKSKYSSSAKQLREVKRDRQNRQKSLQKATDAVSSIPEIQEVMTAKSAGNGPQSKNVKHISSVAPQPERQILISPMGKDVVSSIPETQEDMVVNTAGDGLQSKNKISSITPRQILMTPDGKGVTNQPDASPDIIPDTPDSAPGKISSTRKTFSSRSFLSSSSSLGNAGRIHKKPVAKKMHSQKKRCSSSVVLARELGNGNAVPKWNSKDETFRSALVETGVDIVQSSNVINMSGWNGGGVKRGSVKGMSPSPKRVAGTLGVSRHALARTKTKLDMQAGRVSTAGCQIPSATKGNISPGKDLKTEAPNSLPGEGKRPGRKMGSDGGNMGVKVGSGDGQKGRESTDEDIQKEDACDVGEEYHPFRWNSQRKSTPTAKTSLEDGRSTSDLHQRDTALGDILSELKLQHGSEQRRPGSTNAVAVLKDDRPKEEGEGDGELYQQTCDHVSSRHMEIGDDGRNGSAASVPRGNAGDSDLMDILTELKEQFAITQSPFEKKCQISPSVPKLRADRNHMKANIPSDLAPSCTVAMATPGGNTSLDEIMKELAPHRGNSAVVVRNLKVSKWSKISKTTKTMPQNCSNKENGEMREEEMQALKAEGIKSRQDLRNIVVDTNDVNTETKESLSNNTNVSQSLSACHVISENDTSSQPRDEFAKPIDGLDSTLMRNFQLDDSLENELNCDFEKLSPFKTFPSRSSSVTVKRHEDIPPATAGSPCQVFGRHRVLGVSKHREDVELIVKGDIDNVVKTVVLQGFWIDTHIDVGDIVNVLGSFNLNNVCTITDTQNLIVVNPDLLISGTAVVSGVFCMRKSILNEKFKGCEGRNVHMLYGSIIHSVFQKVLQERAFTEAAMTAVAKAILVQSKFLHEMYGQAVTENSLMEEIEKYLPPLQHFVDTYVSSNQPNASLRRSPQVSDVITQVVDIEENIWSPRYGIKGKIDLTVEMKSQKDQTSKVVPLELKTGKATYSVEHKGQVTLYSMMMSDRRQDPNGGLLLYLREGDMKTIPAGHANKRGLIQLRNELAHFVKSSSEKCDPTTSTLTSSSWPFGVLPEPINRGQFCGKCPQLLNCAAVQRSVEERIVSEGHPMASLVPQALSHLSPSHLAYFSHWMKLTHLELGTDSKKKGSRGLWCNTGAERESAGACLSGMRLVALECGLAGVDVYELTFSRTERHTGPTSLSDVGLASGDSVVISAENRSLIALATGFIQRISETHVTLLTDRDLRCNVDQASLVFRLDKCDTFNSMGTNLANISRLLADNSNSVKLRELVIDRRQPMFDLTLSKATITKVRHIFKTLNKPQKAAILKVLMCKDYILIKGYPGTGKTSTIVALVRILATLGQSVLLTSYTHSAVDNILLKLKQFDIDIVRIGRLGKIHVDIRPFAAETLTAGFRTVQELNDFYLSKSVIATTCLGTNHAVFSRRVFDLCIVDEASQVLQPACLGPLLVSRRFVLVGDPLQLPPVVQSREARDLGMAESLFARLDDTGGTYELDLQYRMNSSIMRLSNELVYGGALKCATETVAAGRLSAPNIDILEKVNIPIWIKTALSPNRGQEVIFLDTDKIPCQETETDSKVKNRAEALIILALAELTKQCGVSPSDIGIIAPYQQQVRLLRDFMREHHLVDVEVNTVDQYQGRDKAAIFMSFVKSRREDGTPGGILSDIRRLNVALTRAKHKLVLVGCIPSLRPYRSVADLLDILDPHQVISLPENTLHQCSRILDPDTAADHLPGTEHQ